MALAGLPSCVTSRLNSEQDQIASIAQSLLTLPNVECLQYCLLPAFPQTLVAAGLDRGLRNGPRQMFDRE